MNIKDSVPGSLRSNVVYKFTCAECNFAYVGETRRHCTLKFGNIYLRIKILTPFVEIISLNHLTDSTDINEHRSIREKRQP